MKRVGRWAIGIGLFVTIGFLTIEPGYATPQCTLATLKGRYLFVGSGTLLPPAFGITKQALFASAGYHIFNGDGTGTDIVTFSIDGVVVEDKSTTPVSYTVNPDCSGTYTVPPPGPSFDIFIAPSGDELTVIGTDLGVVGFQAPQRRVAPK
jgi:hypothetical protein